MTPDPAALATYTTGVLRARDAYDKQPNTAKHASSRCRCGKRTTARYGVCRECQKGEVR